MDSEGARLLESHLPEIERVSAEVCRRRGLRGDEADDFWSWMLSRLADGDGAILRKFRGDSSMTTYLVVVINNLFRDYRIHLWGKWRPSATARRLGPVAVALEALLERDSRSLAEATAELRSRGITGPSERQLGEIAGLLPHRTPTRPVEAPPAVVDATPSRDDPERSLERRDAEAERDRVVRALIHALEAIPAEDAVLVRLRYFEGFTLAATARALGLKQKPLYRRLEGILRRLRQAMEQRGVSAARVATILTDPPSLEPPGLETTAGEFGRAVSVQSREG